MYMVDTEEHKTSSFGYTNQDGDIEGVSYVDSMVRISYGFNEFFFLPY